MKIDLKIDPKSSKITSWTLPGALVDRLLSILHRGIKESRDREIEESRDARNRGLEGSRNRGIEGSRETRGSEASGAPPANISIDIYIYIHIGVLLSIYIDKEVDRDRSRVRIEQALAPYI